MIHRFFKTVLIACVVTGCVYAEETAIYFQAHRGGLDEVAENTLAAVRYAWGIEGAVPEVDVATTKDGEFVILHDATLARTTNAAESIRNTPVSALTLEQVRSCDAGIRFGEQFKGERVPLLTEILDEMMKDDGRRIYLDVKDADFKKLVRMLLDFGIEDRVIFVHGDPKKCAELRSLAPKAGAMTWLSGTSENIKKRFDSLKATGFAGLTQLQFHAHTKDNDRSTEFVLDDAFLRQAAAETRSAGVELQLRPFNLSPDCMKYLLDIGVRWYVADAPKRFTDAVKSARAK
jgi:glycerophosphoryl diester phosphodiesterase